MGYPVSKLATTGNYIVLAMIMVVDSNLHLITCTCTYTCICSTPSKQQNAKLNSHRRTVCTMYYIVKSSIIQNTPILFSCVSSATGKPSPDPISPDLIDDIRQEKALYDKGTIH